MNKDLQDIDFKSFNTDNLLTKKKNPVKSHLDEEKGNENMMLLFECQAAWDSLSDFRYRRERARKYYRGDQWHEVIIDPDKTDGSTIKEEDYIKNQGKIPLKQNIMRQLGKNIIGQYRQNPSKSVVIARNRSEAKKGEMLTNVLQFVHDVNRTRKLDARLLEEKMLSGASIQKIQFHKYHPISYQPEVFINNVSTSRFFCNTDVADSRLTDLHLIGEIIDDNIDDVISNFAKNKEDEEKIRDWYVHKSEWMTFSAEGFSPEIIDNLDFFNTSEPHKVRLYEIWQLKYAWRIYAHDTLHGTYGLVDYTMKEINGFNDERVQAAIEQGADPETVPLIKAKGKHEGVWVVKYLTPWGQTLYETETPYLHGSHPYAIDLYPMLDGEVWGLMEDIIDQQRYINRLICLHDFIMGASAKGVLIIAEESVEDAAQYEEVVDQWSKFNGVIKLKMKPGVPVPQQIAANSVNIGISELLALQMKLIQEISGVSSAVQGQGTKAGTPSSLYAQQAQNSMTNIADFMESFNEFKKDRDFKVIKIIQQFYQEKKFVAIAGSDYNDEASIYDPMEVKEIEFDVVVSQGIDTPTYRQVMDDTLMNLLSGQMIDIKMFLENSSLPFADKLLTSINQRQEELAKGQVSPEILQQIQQGAQGANPQATQLFNRALQPTG